MGFNFTSLGNTSNSSGATLALTLSTAVPFGAWVVLAAWENTTSTTVPNVTDSRGNNWNDTALAPGGGSNGLLSLGYAPVTTALQIGDSLTYHKDTSGASTFLTAGFLTGVLTDVFDGVDDDGFGSGTSNKPSATTFGPSYFGEYYLAAIYYAGNPTYIPPANFQTTAMVAGISGSTIACFFQLNNSLSAETYAPSLSTSEPWAILIQSFVPAFSAYVQGTDNTTDRMIADGMRPIMVPAR